MILPVLIITILHVQVLLLSAHVYKEPISDLLIKCNAYQYQVHFKNRTVHVCEKKDPDEDFSFFITPMTTQYTKREFLCVLFFKADNTKLDFKLLFSHAQFEIDGVNRELLYSVSCR